MEVNLFIVTAALQAFPTATGCVPLDVQFTNNSVNATQFFWDFGDGGTSTITNPSHVFTDTGTYLIMLIASDPTACVPFDTAYTTVIVYNTTVEALRRSNAHLGKVLRVGDRVAIPPSRE